MPDNVIFYFLHKGPLVFQLILSKKTKQKKTTKLFVITLLSK